MSYHLLSAHTASDTVLNACHGFPHLIPTTFQEVDAINTFILQIGKPKHRGGITFLNPYS